eukprot:XP_001698965.1 plastid lipid associated protein [Chlamydomonas reinhardtii]
MLLSGPAPPLLALPLAPPPPAQLPPGPPPPLALPLAPPPPAQLCAAPGPVAALGAPLQPFAELPEPSAAVAAPQLQPEAAAATVCDVAEWPEQEGALELQREEEAVRAAATAAATAATTTAFTIVSHPIAAEDSQAAADAPDTQAATAVTDTATADPEAATAAATADPLASPEGAKAALLDAVYATARGVNATPQQRAAIDELVAALEAQNPNTAPTDAVSALAGRWKLVYTSNVGTVMLLGALDNLPLVDVGDVCQTIDPVTLTATNKVDLAVPMMLSLRAESGLEVRSPRQFKSLTMHQTQVRLTKVGLDTFISTPQLLAALEIPESVTVLGATLDLGPLRRLVEPINNGLEAAQDLMNRVTAPELPLGPSMSSAASLWMLTTYLDDNLRISRDDEGRVFVMLKDVAMSQDPAEASQ